MAANIQALLYVVSGVLFIMALRGLSHPTTSRQGNLFGMVGMGIAVLTTVLFSPPAGFSGWFLVVLGLGIGGGIGAFMARRVQMARLARSRRPRCSRWGLASSSAPSPSPAPSSPS
jgi:H+-translocating NAD(P) transhydrogenase subunit beta